VILSRSGRLAQLVEHLLYTQVAAGSSPAPPIARPDRRTKIGSIYHEDPLALRSRALAHRPRRVSTCAPSSRDRRARRPRRSAPTAPFQVQK
jgi:hypothetical protein